MSASRSSTIGRGTSSARGVGLALLLFASGSCAGRQRPAIGPAGGAADLAFRASDREGDTEFAWVVYRRGSPTDSAGMRVGEIRTIRGSVPGHSTRVTTVTNWLAPFNTTDTLVTDRRTRLPVYEALVGPALRFRYRFDGRHVTGTIHQGNAAARRVDVTLADPVFASNQTELLVRALRFRVGLRAIVPMFSETDLGLEHDTITVERDTTTRLGRSWIIRFADPAIVTHYVVTARPPEVVQADTYQRQSGVVFRRVLRMEAR